MVRKSRKRIQSNIVKGWNNQAYDAKFAEQELSHTDTETF